MDLCFFFEFFPQLWGVRLVHCRVLYNGLCGNITQMGVKCVVKHMEHVYMTYYGEFSVPCRYRDCEVHLL